jgi:hypothetical protein
MVLEEYEKKDITKSPKTKAAPKKGEIYKDGDIWKFIWDHGNVCGYLTKDDAEAGLEKLSGQAKRET